MMYNIKTCSPIMESMDGSLSLNKDEVNLEPNLYNEENLTSIPIVSTINSNGEHIQCEAEDQTSGRSLLLMDANENLHVATPELFCKKLKCSLNDKIKVISIFGNTGDGKSHTMNNVFFNGEQIFKTSSEQNSCTIGVYAAMEPKMGVLCLDTEGLLGTTSKSKTRTRMLLKILAISDIVIYRTRSERLHSDMFEFLGTASEAFCTYFADALQKLAIPGTAKTLGPAVILFHETRHTKPLDNAVNESAEDKLRDRFSSLGYQINAFSSLQYVGIKTDSSKSTDYTKIMSIIRDEIKNTTVRSSRQPEVVFKAIKDLNRKFSGEIEEKNINPFSEQYFSCTVHCESCSQRCQRSMGHIVDGENHMNKHPCKYQHQFENKVYLCKTCHRNGKEIIVTTSTQTQNDSSWYGMAKYAWKGPVIECPNCGEIYRARQYWYGNKSPELTAVRSEIVHVWKGGNITTKGPTHSAQMVVDGVTYLSDAISSISAQPAKALTDWFADKVAPSYWIPNHEITLCNACQINFEKSGKHKHHCRGCGKGFCHTCSPHKMPVPARGWAQPVRVCNDCRQKLLQNAECIPGSSGATPSNDEADILVRKYGETIYNTLTSVASAALEFPKEIIKDTARPSYWVPDSESPNCSVCKMLFGTAEELEIAKTNGLLNSANASNSTANNTIRKGSILMGHCKRHHCRSCGNAVCEQCSKTRRPVPERGWPTDVRVCDACACLDNKAKLD